MCLMSSPSKFSTGLNSDFSPLARMCARYLLSLERRATDSLALRLKCFMIAKMNNSRREEESAISLLGLILEMSTYAALRRDITLFLVALMVVSKPSENLKHNLVLPINYFRFLVLADSNSEILQLGSKSFKTYIMLFQLLTLLTAVLDACSYILYPSTIFFMAVCTVRPLSRSCFEK